MNTKTIIPAVKNCNFNNGKLVFKNIVLKGENTEFAQRYLNFFLNGAVSAENENANMLLTLNSELKKGAYNLTVNEKINVEYSCTQGLRNALATFFQLIEVSNGSFCVDTCEINDYPDCDLRSVLIDLARGLPDFSRLKEDILRLSLAKCTHVHLHLMDEKGLCYESDVFKMDDDIRGTKLYTKEMLKELVVYCKQLGIEIIPEFEIPAHSHYLTRHIKQVACKTNLQSPSPAVVCAGNEETYAFYTRLIKELCEIFPCEYLHMGGDELYFGDFPSWNWKPVWEHCEVCKEVMAKNNINSIQEMYYYVVRRIYDIVKAQGKTLVIFNDQLDVSKPLDLPKDIVIQFWRIAANKNRGPVEGCSYNKFLEQGFKVIASPFEYTYIDAIDFVSPERCSTFDFTDYNDSAEYNNNLVGGEVCAWEYGNPAFTHYKFSFTSGTVLLLAKMWNKQNVVYDKAYRRMLSKIILGVNTPKDYDIFELFASIMPPKVNDVISYANKQNELITDEILEKHTAVLKSLSNTYSKIYLQNLLELIEKIS